MAPPKLVLQTTYAELLDRAANAAFGEAFAEEGAFTVKTVKDRKYWYFQSGTRRKPEPTLHRSRDARIVGAYIAPQRPSRRRSRGLPALVSTLVRSFGLPRPFQKSGMF